MTILYWIVGIIVGIALVYVIFTYSFYFILFRLIDLGLAKRPTSRYEYYGFQKWRLKLVRKQKVPILCKLLNLEKDYKEFISMGVKGYIENEFDWIRGDDDQTKMDKLNAWGDLFVCDLIPRYTPEEWKKEGLAELESKVINYAKSVSPEDIDLPIVSKSSN